MAFEYISLDDALTRPGLRMVVVGGIPSPWGEAAKGILHVKGIDWAAVRLVYDDPRLVEWAGDRSGPVAVIDGERPRSRWDDILLLAERLAPEPSLLPADAADRALVFGLSHELCGEGGLGWSRRLQLIDRALRGESGFHPEVAGYLGHKYGHSPARGAAATARVVDLLSMLAKRLRSQRAAGSGYFVGERLTAVDIYSATFMAMFRPLPDAVCPMRASTRAAFEVVEPESEAALDPILIEHRDRIYAEHLELPLSL